MGADVLSSFVISGFQSLYAMSDEPCMPFDKHRKGINLGEACATVILSKDEKLIVDSEKIYINGTAMTNDANHISGPSRTGEELKIAISKSLQLSNLQPQEINFISAHGTATLFNDDMESKALHLAGMATTPVNSLKGYFGHTLGAAGVIESVISLHSLRNNIIVGTCNFSESGTAEIINVTSKNESKIMTHCMKTASGFGGCNAAAVFSKN
jgi:3-oxoacyl-[acyl-carrier-protein] synthase I